MARSFSREILAAAGVLLGLAIATPSSAVVTVNHSTTGPTTIAVGDAILVQVRVTWDGQGSLQGIFSSTQAANGAILTAESAANGATMYRGSLFAFTDPDTGDATSLSRFGQGQLRQGVDPTNAVRSVQYGSLAAINPSGAATNVLVTTITFRALAAGTTTIGTTNLLGDTGAQGDTTGSGTTVTVTVPEPQEIALGLAALGSVAGMVAIRRRI